MNLFLSPFRMAFQKRTLLLFGVFLFLSGFLQTSLVQAECSEIEVSPDITVTAATLNATQDTLTVTSTVKLGARQMASCAWLYEGAVKGTVLPSATYSPPNSYSGNSGTMTGTVTNTTTLDVSLYGEGTHTILMRIDSIYGNPKYDIHNTFSFTIDRTAPAKNNLTVSSLAWNPNGSNTYTITLSASDTGSAVDEMRALINFQGSNEPNYRGYFAWKQSGYTWSGSNSGDQISCSGDGYADKYIGTTSSGYGQEHITLLGCSSTTSGNQKTVTFTVRPATTFGNFGAINDISFWTRDSRGNTNGWTNYDLNFSSDSQNPVQNSVTVSSPHWRTNGVKTYTITVTATDAFSGIANARALINFQGSNTPNYRGYFAWKQASYTWSGSNSSDQISCTGGGYADKYVGTAEDGYGKNTVTLIGCSTSLNTNQRTVTFTVRPETSFGDFASINDVSFWTQDGAGNTASWVSYDTNFSSDNSAPQNPTVFTGTINAQSANGLSINTTNPTIQFSWSGAADLHSGIADYQVVLQRNSDGAFLYAPSTGVVTSYTLVTSGLVKGESYNYWIRAKNGAGMWNSKYFPGGTFTIIDSGSCSYDPSSSSAQQNGLLVAWHAGCSTAFANFLLSAGVPSDATLTALTGNDVNATLATISSANTLLSAETEWNSGGANVKNLQQKMTQYLCAPQMGTYDTAQIIADYHLASTPFFMTSLLSCSTQPQTTPLSSFSAEGNANDSVGSNNGTLGGNATFATGKSGQAFVFDGDGDYVSIPDNTSIKLQELTLEAWVYPTELNTWDSVLMKSDGGWGMGYGLAHYTGTNDINFFVQHYENIKVSGSIALNTWTHVVGTYDGANLKLYINGVLVDTFAYSGGITYQTNPLYIGQAGGGGYGWGGKIDEVKIYNTALSAAEIADRFSSSQ